MNYCIFIFRSVTFAQRAQRILGGADIGSSLMRTPGTLTRRGCSYSLRLRERDADSAHQLLREAQAPEEEGYVLLRDGAFREWRP